MSAELTVYIDEQSPKKFTLGPIFTIGRGIGNDLVINDGRVSRNHAAIRLQSDMVYYLVDLGSSNGTLLNGRRVTIPSALKTGDEFLIADHRIEFLNDATDKFEASPQEEDMRTQLQFTSVTVSILVVDIRNYTVLSESIPTEDLSQIIGKWFHEVVQVVNNHGGTIHKFIGDAAMAYWQKSSDASDKSYIVGPLWTATKLVETAKIFDQQLSSRYSSFNFRVGCGIHAGRAIMGNVGDFTTVGDDVNMAFRMESLCKELQVPIVLSEDVKNIAGNEFSFKDLGLQKIKGKSKELRVYTIA